MNAVATAYDAAGTVLETYPLAFAGRQTLSLDAADLFPAVLDRANAESLDLKGTAPGARAWIGVDGDNILFGDAFVLNDEGQTLTIYPGLAAR